MDATLRLLMKGGTRLVICILVLGIGMAGFGFFSSLKRPPAEAERRERSLRVEVLRVAPEDIEVSLSGTGVARALTSVVIAPEVGGRVLETHPRLDVGEVIPEGETLFIIDPRTYEAQVEQSRALAAQWNSSIRRLELQMAQDRQRLITLSRTRDLARGEYDRVRNLLEKDQVGTQSGVDQAEQAYNASRDAVDRLEQQLAIYPVQIEEARSSLASAEATLRMREIDLERTRVTAPFRARIQSVNLEAGQIVQPGAPVMTLADDSTLELSIPLDSRDAREWLQFNGGPQVEAKSWFAPLKPVRCRIHWTEDPGNHTWEGTLHRVEQFNQETLTVWVAVRVEGADAISKDEGRLPLVEGMFCRVVFPGRELRGVYRLPRWAVSFDNTVYRANDGRLRRVPVQVARSHGDEAFVAEGLAAGDLVVVTRLVNPLEGTLLEIGDAEAAAEIGR